jgi:arsenite methyltransferase
VARALAPGGRFLIYDVHAKTPLSACLPEEAMAVRLTETATVLPHGFLPLGAWEAALQRAGLNILKVVDFSAQVQPDQLRLQKVGLQVLADWKKRMALKVMPRYMARNLVAALLAPLIYHVPHKSHPGGPLVYQLIVAGKPQ